MRKNILIVEDELIIGMYAKQLLDDKGYNAVIVKTGEKAVEYIKSNKVDMIVMDIQLEGDLNGIETANEIKSFNDVPIIFLTGNSDPATLQRAEESAPYGIITKPLDESDFYSTIKTAFFQYNTKKDFHIADINYQLLFNKISNGIAIIKTNKKGDTFFFVALNDSFEKLFSVKSDNFINKSINTLFHKNTFNDICDKIKRVFKTGEEGQYTIIERSGNELSKYIKTNIHKLQSGEIVMVFEDETESEKANEDLQKQYKLFNKLLDNNPTAVMVIDKNNKPVYINKSFQDMFSDYDDIALKPEELTERLIITDYDDNPISAKDLPYIKARNEKKNINNLKLKLKDKINNKILYIKANINVLLDDNGDIDKIVINIQDLTEKMNLEEQLIQSNNDLINANEKLQETNEELEETNEELRSTLEEAESSNIELLMTQQSLRRKIKELNIFFEISKTVDKNDYSIRDILFHTAQIIADGFNPQILSGVKIILDSTEFKNRDFQKTKTFITSNLCCNKDITGSIIIYYKIVNKSDYPDEYIKEDKQLLESICERLGKTITRIRINDKLKGSVEFFKTFIDAIPSPVFIKNMDKVYTNCNYAFADLILGLPKEEIIGKTMFEFGDAIPYELAELYDYKDNEIINSGRRQVYESKVKCKDGKRRYFLFHKALFFNKHNQGGGIVGVMLDITGRKTIEKELNWEVKVNKTIADLAHELLSVNENKMLNIATMISEKVKELTNSKYAYVGTINPDTKNLQSHTLSNMMGKDCTIQNHENITEFPIGKDGIYPSLWGHALNTREGFFTNDPASHPASNGVPTGHITLENFLSVPAVKGGKLLGQIAIANNEEGFNDKHLELVKKIADLYAISIEEARIKDNLETNEKLYRAIVEDQTEMIYRCDVDGVITFVNNAYADFVGKSKEELTGSKFRSKIPDSDMEKLRLAFEKTSPENPIMNVMYRVIKPDGSIRWVKWANRVFYKDNTAIEFQGVGRDITKQVIHEREVKLNEARLKYMYNLMQMINNSIEDIKDYTLEKSIELTESKIGFIGTLNEDGSKLKVYNWSGNVLDRCEVDHTLITFDVESGGLWTEAVKQRDVFIINDYNQPHSGKKGLPKGHISIKNLLVAPIFKNDNISFVIGVANKETDYNSVDVKQLQLLMEGMTSILDRKEYEERTEKSARENEVLLKEIHHRVKNNLQIIISLLSFQSKYIKDSYDKEIFKDSENRIRTMALVHEMMYRNTDFSDINLKEFLTELTEQVKNTYSHNQAELNINAEDIYVDLDKAIPCAQIINELFTNSIKHSQMSKDYVTKININLYREATKGVNTLIIQDNGKGFPEDFDFEKSDTLGLQLVDALVEQIGATIRFEDFEGVKVTIHF